jgi:hypothetical protein
VGSCPVPEEGSARSQGKERKSIRTNLVSRLVPRNQVVRAVVNTIPVVAIDEERPLELLTDEVLRDGIAVLVLQERGESVDGMN